MPETGSIAMRNRATSIQLLAVAVQFAAKPADDQGGRRLR